MKVVVIGGTGHIGTFLIPRLIEAGHEVIVISRKHNTLYLMNAAWQDVQWVTFNWTKMGLSVKL